MNAFLQPRLKLWIHLVEIALILPIMILVVVRVTMGVSFRSNGARMGLAFGAKSLVFIAYQLLTEHVQRLKRWRSLKAYAIINGAEIVFWGAVVYLTIASLVGKTCSGTVCALGWVIVVLAIVMCPLCSWLFAICFFDFRALRAAQAAGGDVDVEGQQAGELPRYKSEAVHTDRSQSYSSRSDIPTPPQAAFEGRQAPPQFVDARYQQATQYHSGYAK